MESLEQHFAVAELTDSEDDSSLNDVERELDVERMNQCTLDISESLADQNYEAAGTEVEEEVDQISIEKNKHLINQEVDSILDDIVTNLKMPYRPSEFQRVSVNALGQQKNVVLVSPTGSGKMNVALLATLVLREKLNIPKGLDS